MLGLMMDTPLVTTSLIAFAAEHHGDVEIVSRSVEGPMHRHTYAEAYARTQQLAGALTRLGVGDGDRVATVASNGYRHFELYFAIPGMGAVCHTVNPRLFHDQIEYIVNHAGDRFIFVDTVFVPLLEGLAGRLKSVEGYIIMTDEAHMPETSLANALCYETLLAAEAPSFAWPALDERQASAMCYTSGTTGNPKGTLYSHRSMVLHSMAACMVDHSLAMSSFSTVMPVVPMYHVHGWGMLHAAPLCGAKVVLPGPRLDAESLVELLDGERVTITAGVPTVWFEVLDHLSRNRKTLDYLDDVLIGGSAVPLSMIREFAERHGVEVMHSWGMTETSPVGSISRIRGKFRDLPAEAQYAMKLKPGRAIYGLEKKIVDDHGNRLPHDGVAAGELYVRGPWVASAYYDDDEATAAAIDDEGWFGTGDVATIDGQGYLQITDRAKDLIKSGGEWISSIDLENAAVAHPDVAEAAAIAVAHPKWGERPLLVVVARPGAAPTAESIRGFLADKVVKWWLPDDIVFVDELPHTATGKISKLTLRQQFADYILSTVET